jgi:hypothetical protein
LKFSLAKMSVRLIANLCYDNRKCIELLQHLTMASVHQR